MIDTMSRPQPPLGDVARSTRPASASCADSQFPAIPVLRTGPLAGGSRRHFIAASAAAFVASSLPSSGACAQAGSPSAGLAEVSGTEHWTVKRAGADNVKLFLWPKRLRSSSPASARRGTVLVLHGASVSASPLFGLPL